MHFTTLLTILTFSAMGIQPGASHGELYIFGDRNITSTKPGYIGVILSTGGDDCYMPCDEQGVWIGPRGDASGNDEDSAVALKRFEDELAEFQRLGEERWPAANNEAQVKVEAVQARGPKARTAKAARRAERRARAT
ncbi:hypothetical protein KVR01_013685 [Diaporthe batatas]|uniref:uncharacterized protein n=1 Tax=Diaporthe batatas TaxID=748121 RepID=UPI001D055485|nr:uncharacterized protein KVR01_013685 [Diaporthe batatas]KAG8156451.1 hypothetical protein KVR01_013685 [Diaporthe batatas]